MLPVVDCPALARNRDRRTGQCWVSRWCSLRRKDDNRFFVCLGRKKEGETRSVTALRRDRRADREDFGRLVSYEKRPGIQCGTWSSRSDPSMNKDFYNIWLQTWTLASPIRRVELETHYLLDPMGCIPVSTKFDLIWCKFVTRVKRLPEKGC